jgi:crossover junction endodeoxyribonuclease RuvC
MFDGCVLGVDPGLARTGLAVLRTAQRQPAIVWSGTVLTPADAPEADRLASIAAEVRSAIHRYRPQAVAVERVIFGANKMSALSVARATGVVMLISSEAGLPVDEYVPAEVKSAVTGLGTADKAQVHTALVRIHGLRDVPRQADAADAVAVALCHLTQARLRRVAARAGIR